MPSFRIPCLLALAIALGLAAAPGCGNDDVGPTGHKVGGRCTNDGDCVKRCLTGSEFPGGYCTEVCATDHDCPGGSVCVADKSNGGICLVTCKVPSDCDAFGAGYQCNRQTSQSGGEGALACLGT